MYQVASAITLEYAKIDAAQDAAAEAKAKGTPEPAPEPAVAAPSISRKLSVHPLRSILKFKRLKNKVQKLDNEDLRKIKDIRRSAWVNNGRICSRVIRIALKNFFHVVTCIYARVCAHVCLRANLKRMGAGSSKLDKLQETKPPCCSAVAVKGSLPPLPLDMSDTART